MLNSVVVLLIGGFAAFAVGREVLIMLLEEAQTWLEEECEKGAVVAVKESIQRLQVGQLPKRLPFAYSSYSYDSYATVCCSWKKLHHMD